MGSQNQALIYMGDELAHLCLKKITTKKVPQQQRICKLKACTPTLNHPCWKPRECYISYKELCCISYIELCSASQKANDFFGRHHIVVWLKPLHALVAAAQTGWAKRMWALREFLREGVLWSGLGLLQEQKENHFYNKQIMSWLFFLEGSRLCWAARYVWLLRTSPSSRTLFRVATDKATLKAPEQTTSSVTNAWLVCS